MSAARSTVATAPSPATTGTSLVVATGAGASFGSGAVSFDALVWPTGVAPGGTNYEVIGVTNVSTDTLTILRAKRGTSARTIVAGDNIRSLASTTSFWRIDDIWSTGDMDFREANGLWLPASAGLAPGNGELGYDTTLDSVVSGSLGKTMRAWRLLSPAQIPAGPDSLTNSVTTEQTFAGNIVFPANFFKQLKPVRLSSGYLYTTGATAGSALLKLKLGTTVIYQSLPSSVGNSMSGHGFLLEWSLMAAAAPGASVALHVTGPSGSALNNALRNTVNPPATIATNASQTLSMTVTFGSSTAADTLTLDQFFASEMG